MTKGAASSLYAPINTRHKKNKNKKKLLEEIKLGHENELFVVMKIDGHYFCELIPVGDDRVEFFVVYALSESRRRTQTP